ncbi:MAG: metallophosphoesterase family protein [Bacteroidetes bacterium]|nr:metallophosphoesterase family protein [Bacteroidota bacterium]
MEQLKEKVKKCIDESIPEIEESDLDEIQKEFIANIDKYLESSSHRSCESIDVKQQYHHFFMDIRDEQPRIVIIGDLHCDFLSFKGILDKLSISDYDYFEKARFIFLGDYIDRGALPLQTLRLLFKLKQILGDRCILLKGNHDTILYDNEDKKYYSNVNPAETIELLNQYFKKETINKIKEFFENLPYTVSIERNSMKYLLVHGGIPKDMYFDLFANSETFKYILPLSDKDEKQIQASKMFNTMLWGDPVDEKLKLNTSGLRFEFGTEQFESFMKQNGYSHLVRGHEPKPNGFESKYKDRLFTVFSTGGNGNESSFYDVLVPDPSFAIIDEDGTLRPESIFCYRILGSKGNVDELTVRKEGLNPEFFLSPAKSAAAKFLKNKVYKMLQD